MPNNNDEDFSYKVGYIIGTLLFNAVFGIVKLLWRGIIISTMKFKPLIIVYVALLCMNIISFVKFHSCIPIIIYTLIIAVIIGIIETIIEYPVKKKRKAFNRIFKEMKFQSADNKYPNYLYETVISDFATMYSFSTLIPLNIWTSKKELLEMYMNLKIIDIKQDETNNRIINLIAETEPLPNCINWNDDFIDVENNILNIGVGCYGVVGMDLEKHPHSFIAGETGSGKSNILKCLIYQALAKNYEVILIDFKRGVSFSSFSNSVDIYYDYKDVIKILRDMVTETTNRLDKFRNAKVDNIIEYNEISGDYLKRKIIFIDELAELLKTRDKEISNILNDSIETLTRLSRAVGIHLIMGIQRPDSTVINGQIKNNVSYRVCGRFVDKEPSRIMLGNDIASTIPNIKGRFIIKDNDLQEIQSFYYSKNKYSTYNEPEYIFPDYDTELIDDGRNDIDIDIDIKEETTEEIVTDNPVNQIEFDFSDFKK